MSVGPGKENHLLGKLEVMNTYVYMKPGQAQAQCDHSAPDKSPSPALLNLVPQS